MRTDGSIRGFTRLFALAAVLLFSFSSPASADDKPRVRVETTKGSFVIELNPQRAPLTVASFLEYVKAGTTPIRCSIA